MSMAVWLKSGRKIQIGGKELILMPLPLRKLYGLGDWFETNSAEIVHETISGMKPGEVPNPLSLVTRVLGKIDVAQVAFEVFSYPKDPDSGEPLNKNITKQFFDDYLDIPTAHKLFTHFIEINDLQELLKNLQSLPLVRKLLEAASLTFGIPYLNSLQANMDSDQKKQEGSPSPKSTTTSLHEASAGMEFGEPLPQQPPTVQ